MENKLKIVQKISYEILKEFKRICDKYSIKYSIGYGTLLGAVRHKGFIPWDDDIDVLIMREEYEKFLKVVDKELNKDEFDFLSVETNKYYGCIIPRIVKHGLYNNSENYKNFKFKFGIQLDIFILDGAPNDINKRKKQAKKVTRLETLMLLKYGGYYSDVSFIKKVIYNLVRIPLFFVPKKAMMKKQYKWLTKYNDSDTVVNFGFIYHDKEYIHKNYFDCYTNILFEDEQFSTIENYKDYLTHYYNNYMELPPVEKRKTHGIINVDLSNYIDE